MTTREYRVSVIAWLASLGLLLALTSMLPAQAPRKAEQAQQRPLGKAVRCVAFSPDGKLLAAGLGDPKQRGRVVLWDVATRKQLWSHQEEEGLPSVAFAPDGKTLAVGAYDHSARILDSATGQTIKILEGHTNYVRAVAFAPDGKTLATGSWDQTVCLWDLPAGTLRRTLDWPGKELFAVSFSPGGQSLLAAGGPLRMWDAASGKEKHSMPGGNLQHIAWAAFADDDCFLTGDNHGTVRAWSVASGELRNRFHGLSGVRRLTYSPGARRLAVSTYFRHDIYLFDFTLKDPTAQEKERLAALLIKLDDDDYALREATGKDILALGFVVEPELRRQMVDSPSAEVRIRCRRLREELLSKPRATLSGHGAEVEGLAFAPNGRLLASASLDGTVRLWNVQEAKECGQLVPVAP